MDHTALVQRLTEEKKRLQATVTGAGNGIDRDESERSSLGELSSVDQHPADHASETFEREKEMTIIGSLEAQLIEIEAALARLDAGTYGKCEACGKPIGEERLEARPTARFCMEHAANHG
ncbi:MAG: TraR/DksA C4-type zinc finger protein [Actinomycetota bacterium]